MFVCILCGKSQKDQLTQVWTLKLLQELMCENHIHFDFLFTLYEPANLLTGRNESETAGMTNWSCFLFLLRDDDEEVGERAAQRQNNRSVLSYFSAPARGGNQNSPDRTHRFFSDRKLKSLDTLWRQKRILHLSDAPTHRWVFPRYWWNSKYFQIEKLDISNSVLS